MQQFVVPQFIDVEGKIIGPITSRQFMIILAGALIMFLAFRFGDFTFFLAISLIVIFFVVLFAFMKVNGRPFHFFLLNLIETVVTRKMLRVWQREEALSVVSHVHKRKKKGGKDEEFQNIAAQLATRTQLSELSLIVDTGGVYQAEEETPYGML